MMQWAWVLGFLAVLLVFAWYMDRRTKRRRLGLLAHELGGGGRLEQGVVSAERIDPGISTRAEWTNRSERPAAGPPS